jgi:formylglycine-generating enzyme required for sulfatase activity
LSKKRKTTLLLLITVLFVTNCEEELKMPAVITLPVTDITMMTAICGGEVTSDGGVSITARGVCWSTSTDPTITDSITIDSSGVRGFASTITGLTPNTTYYVRAYAETNQETFYGDNESFTTDDYGVMIYIEGNTFTMGDIGGHWASDETPTHEVTISSFYMGKYEVTQTLYQKVMGKNPSYLKGDNLPVERVSWYDVIEFCNAMSKRQGLTPTYTISGADVTCDFSKNGYRLPTEAEWEYAAGGGASNRTKFAGTNIEFHLDNYAWYSSNSENKIYPVGTKQPNSLGLYDLTGNVWEWCWDWYGSYSSTSQINPTGPASGSSRVIRGGSWYSSALMCRVVNRYNSDPSHRSAGNGFRFVRNAE